MSGALTPAEVRERLFAVCRGIVAASDRLSKADREIGDGDHGVTMARGFAAANEALANAEAPSPREDFRTLGVTLMSRCGGAAGVIFGTLFIAMGRELPVDRLDAESMCRALRAAAEAIKRRGGAQEGDKTMLDALAPAAEAACANSATDVHSLLERVAAAAAKGAEATRDMLPRTGKAKTMGERALGHIDPGALSLAYIFRAFAGDRPAHREESVSAGDAITRGPERPRQ